MSWGVFGGSWSPLTPPAASEQTAANSLHFCFSPLKLPKALLTSHQFSSLFLSRLGSLLGSILAPSWAPFWPKFGPSCLLIPYFFENVNFQKNDPRPRREHDFGDRSGPRSAQDGSKIAPRSSSRATCFRLRFCLRFCCVLRAFLATFWAPTSAKCRPRARAC